MYGQIICHQSLKNLIILNVYYTANIQLSHDCNFYIILFNSSLILLIHLKKNAIIIIK